MSVILLLAALAIVGGVVLAALGRAGEMATFPGDGAPLELDAGEVTPAGVALLRPPTALWGYQVQATEQALGMIARSMAARDAEIAALRWQLASLHETGAARESAARQEPAESPWARPAGERSPWTGTGAGMAGSPDAGAGEAAGWPTRDEPAGWPTRDEPAGWPTRDEPADGSPSRPGGTASNLPSPPAMSSDD